MTAGTEAITEVLVGGAGPAGLTTALLLVPLCHWTVATSLGSVRGAQARLTAMSNLTGHEPDREPRLAEPSTP